MSRPVLFLHGCTDSRRSVEHLPALLPAAIRAVVPGRRGHGGSDLAPDAAHVGER